MKKLFLLASTVFCLASNARQAYVVTRTDCKLLFVVKDHNFVKHVNDSTNVLFVTSAGKTIRYDLPKNVELLDIKDSATTVSLKDGTWRIQDFSGIDTPVTKPGTYRLSK